LCAAQPIGTSLVIIRWKRPIKAKSVWINNAVSDGFIPCGFLATAIKLTTPGWGALKGLLRSFLEAQYEHHNDEEQVRWNHGGEMHEASWCFE
jgi:hypothetical protein